MDQFREDVATKKSSGLQSAMIGVAWVIMIASALYAVMLLQGVFMVYAQVGFGLQLIVYILQILVFGGIAVLLFMKKDTFKTDYEYTFTNGTLDFAEVYNNRRRKSLGTMNLKNITACGLVTSGSFNRYINMPGIKRNNWFANRDGELFYLYYEKDSKKRIIVIEPTEEMVTLIRRAVQQGVYQVN